MCSYRAPNGPFRGPSGRLWLLTAFYEPPAVTYLGTVAELTQQGAKTVGAADGSTFLGLNIGS